MKIKKTITISPKNEKVKCPLFNLPCGVTCKKGLKCSKYCYAKKAEIQYHHVVPPARHGNLNQSKKASFVYNMVDKLKRKRCKYFRIHESGDFYSIGYIKKWYEIAKQLPNITFYCYTKRTDLFNKTLLKQKPSNLNITLSIDGLCNNGFDLDQMYIDAKAQGYDSIAAVTSRHKSNCPAQKDKDLKCIKDCTKCAKPNQIIVFKKH